MVILLKPNSWRGFRLQAQAPRRFRGAITELGRFTEQYRRSATEVATITSDDGTGTAVPRGSLNSVNSPMRYAFLLVESNIPGAGRNCIEKRAHLECGRSKKSTSIVLITSTPHNHD